MFLRSWSHLAGPNLFVRSKWHTTQINVTVGDIVWLCDQNALRGQFKLDRVVTVNPDPKGIVTDVNVGLPFALLGPQLQRPDLKQLTSSDIKGSFLIATVCPVTPWDFSLDCFFF